MLEDKEPEKYLYRYEGYTTSHSSLGIDGEYSYSGFKDHDLNLLKFKVIKETKHSYFIKVSYPYKSPKRVPKEGLNLFAHSTKDKAITNFYYKKRKQINILRSRLNSAEQFKCLAEKFKTELLNE